MDELEARMEGKEEENVGAEQEEDKEVEEPRIDKVEVVVAASKVELECGAAKDDVLLGGGALDPGEGDCEIGAKVKVEVTCIGKVVKEIRVAQVQVERIDVYKVRVEEFSNLEVLRDGQFDPGEVRGNWKDAQWLVQQFRVNQELDEGWDSVGPMHDFLGHDNECDLQMPEFGLQRFVDWVMHPNSDFG